MPEAARKALIEDENCASVRAGTDERSPRSSSRSNVFVARASASLPAGVSSMIDERRSSGLGRRLQYPDASIESTSLLTPPADR